MDLTLKMIRTRGGWSSFIGGIVLVVMATIEASGTRKLHHQISEVRSTNTPIPGPRPWPRAIIPYTVTGMDKTKYIVEKMASKISAVTCVRFKKDMTGQDTKRVGLLKIIDDRNGCWTSHAGYSNKKGTVMNLGKGCRQPGPVLHELMHAMGFLHEHSRPDRNMHVAVNWTNVKLKNRSNFKLKPMQWTMDLPYDYNSILHYRQRAFAKDRRFSTLVPLKKLTERMGNMDLSKLDILRINTFYKCPEQNKVITNTDIKKQTKRKHTFK